MKEQTRHGLTGWTDNAHAGLLHWDFRTQQTPPAPDVIRREAEQQAAADARLKGKRDAVRNATK